MKKNLAVLIFILILSGVTSISFAAPALDDEVCEGILQTAYFSGMAVYGSCDWV